MVIFIVLLCLLIDITLLIFWFKEALSDNKYNRTHQRAIWGGFIYTLVATLMTTMQLQAKLDDSYRKQEATLRERGLP